MFPAMRIGRLAAGARSALRQALSVLVLAFVSAVTTAGGVYKWVDEKGKVHYGDRPPGAGVTEAAEVRLRPPPGRAAQFLSTGEDLVGRKTQQRRLLEVMELERKERAEGRAKKADEIQKRTVLKKKCAKARQTLEQYRRASHLFAESSSGERKVLSHAERAQAEQKLAASITEHCG